jgi:hypothetical protein
VAVLLSLWLRGTLDTVTTETLTEGRPPANHGLNSFMGQGGSWVGIDHAARRGSLLNAPFRIACSLYIFPLG